MTLAARPLGGRAVSPIGVGTVGVSLMRNDHDAGVRALCAAFDAGVTWVDTAAAYVPSAAPGDAGHNERIVADAIEQWGGDADTITIVTKGGHKRVGDGLGLSDFEVCGRSDYIREQCEASLRALRRDVVDVYLLHWPDPATPIEESMAALVDLQQAGLVRHVGLSNVDVDQARAAAGVGRVAAVQNHFPVGSTKALPVVRWCESAGAAFMAYSPLGGSFSAKGIGDAHPAFAAVARARSISPQRVALAWVLAQSDALLAVVGATRPESIVDSVRALEVELTADEFVRLSG